MRFLIDADWIIDGLAGIPSALKAVEDHLTAGVAVSIVTLGELYEGAQDHPHPNIHIENLHRFLSGLAVVGLDDPIMRLFGYHRYRLRKQGKLIPDLDLLIAATALRHDLTIMTRNLRHSRAFLISSFTNQGSTSSNSSSRIRLVQSGLKVLPSSIVTSGNQCEKPIYSGLSAISVRTPAVSLG